jgi:phosphopantetheinyl transferase
MIQADSRIELWLVDLARCAPALDDLERHTLRLADDDRERAGAIRDSTVRRERMAAYIALRVVLERVAGAGVRRLPFVRAEGRAPRLAEGAARFSLSHTEGFALIGVTATLPIGVDLEWARPLTMRRHRRAEIYAVGAGLGREPLPEAENDRAAIQAWVRLEAFTKARERALIATLADLGLRGKQRRRLPPDRVKAAARQLARQADLAVFDLDLPGRLEGAAAFGVAGRLPRLRQFPASRTGIERLLASPGGAQGLTRARK